jgi:uncharacterized protein YqhQ
MTEENYLTYPGFGVSFLVPREHDTDKLDEAIAEIKRTVTESAELHLPPGCQVALDDTV